jgi:hypothetical protein
MNTQHCRAALVNVPIGGYTQYCRDPTETRESIRQHVSDTARIQGTVRVRDESKFCSATTSNHQGRLRSMKAALAQRSQVTSTCLKNSLYWLMYLHSGLSDCNKIASVS